MMVVKSLDLKLFFKIASSQTMIYYLILTTALMVVEKILLNYFFHLT